MPVAAQCPNCGKNLSETSVVAGAPHCTACGAWIVGVNGTLGLTSAYGHGDSSLTRRRVEADLTVLHEYQMKYSGMMEDCKQKLGWSVEQHAKFNNLLPQPPKLLEIQETNEAGLFVGVIVIIIGILGIYWTSPWVPSQVWVVGDGRYGLVDGLMYNMDHAETRTVPPGADIVDLIGRKWIISGHWHAGFFSSGIYPDWALPWWILCFFFVLCVWYGFQEPIKYLKAINANGDRPRENVRRTEAFEMALSNAMRDAERKKSAEDHRLRAQIRELEGEIKAVGDKAADVRRILTSL